MPGARPFPFGHLGDGNIHLNVANRRHGQARHSSPRREVNAAVYAIVGELGGTISAEHGIGRPSGSSHEVKSPVEIDLMRRLKAALDPNGILNPGKVL